MPNPTTSTGSSPGRAPNSPRAAWRRRAACALRLDLDWIEPTNDDATECRRICTTCPVAVDCLRASLTAGEPWGIWGGLDEDERAAVAAAIGMDMPRVIPVHGTNARYVKHRCRCTACRAAHTDYERRRRSIVRRRRCQDRLTTR